MTMPWTEHHANMLLTNLQTYFRKQPLYVYDRDNGVLHQHHINVDDLEIIDVSQEYNHGEYPTIYVTVKTGHAEILCDVWTTNNSVDWVY